MTRKASRVHSIAGQTPWYQNTGMVTRCSFPAVIGSVARWRDVEEPMLFQRKGGRPMPDLNPQPLPAGHEIVVKVPASILFDAEAFHRTQRSVIAHLRTRKRVKQLDAR
jgi:hypothetical protein